MIQHEISQNLSGAKLAAYQKFESLGFPTTHHEDWRYTNLKKLLPSTLTSAKNEAVPTEVIEEIKKQFPKTDGLLFFNNGVFDPVHSHYPKELNLTQSTQVESETEEIKADALTYLNQALSPTTVTELHIPKNYKGSLLIIKYARGVATTAYGSILNLKLDEGAELVLGQYQTDHQESTGLSTGETSIVQEKNSKLTLIDLVHARSQEARLNRTNITLKRDAHLHSVTLLLSSQLTRADLNITLNETGAHAIVDALYTLKDQGHADIFSHIHHASPHTTSEQLVKGILAGEARGVFTGKVVVHKNAVQVNASQLNKNLLMTKKAHVNTRPQLEVYADDVKCAHGATIGQLNPDELFYLQSRGLDGIRAQQLICHAFVLDVIEKLELPLWRESLSLIVEREFEVQMNKLFLQEVL